MTHERKIKEFNKLKFLVGAGIFVLMLWVHFFVKPVEPMWLWTFPAILLGIDPAMFIKRK